MELAPEEQRASVDAFAVTKERERTFITTLEGHYAILFDQDPHYVLAKARTTPRGLAEEMAQGLINGDASKDGEGVKRTCKALAIPHTYKAIRAYLAGA